MIDAKQVCIHAVDTFSQRHTHFRNRQTTGVADGEEIFARFIVRAARKVIRLRNVAENPATHEYVGVVTLIRFDLFKAFIHPMDTIFAADHSRIFARGVINNLFGLFGVRG
jgi:hypothetical protein